jgi:hypothetical protein
MLEFLQGKASERKLRLFACACCRRVGRFLTDDRSRKLLDAAEQFADGETDLEHLRRTLDGPNQLKSVVEDLCWREAWWAAYHVVFDAAAKVCEASGDPEGDLFRAESAAQGRLLRDVMGNPFRPAHLHRKKVSADKGRTLKLAHSIYADRAFDRLPELADALEHAGCSNADILDHCRQPGEHVRGCWVVDLTLGRG